MKMISENHNYDGGYIGLVNLELPVLPKTLKVKGYDLLLKSEFHISLICVKRIAPLIDQEKAEQTESEIITFFQDFIKTTSLKDYSPKNVYRLVKRDERVTIICMVEVPGIEKLFTALEEKYSVKLPLQQTHITLYTLQPEAGIGLLSQEELERESEIVDVPIKF